VISVIRKWINLENKLLLMKIKSISREKYTGVVYDLTVVKNHNYFVSNCLVHNCHEKSTVDGLHGDEELGLNLFRDLPAGAELAIGGGNPLSWDGLYRFTDTMKERGVICNITVNSVHVRKFDSLIESMVQDKTIHGLGISYFRALLHNCLPFTKMTPNVVFHVIMGVHTIEDLRHIIKTVPNAKVLLLGYKQYGRGEKYFSPTIEKNLYDWYVTLHEFFKVKDLTLSFDNLGIKQMKLERFFDKEQWNQFYMGDDGKFTLFVDLVKLEYCKSSTTPIRYKIEKDDNSESIFRKIREIG